MSKTIHQLANAEVEQRLDTLNQGKLYFARDGYSIHMDIDRPQMLSILKKLRIPARLAENRLMLVTHGHARFVVDMVQYDVKAPCYVLLKDKMLLRIQSMSANFLCHMVACSQPSVLSIEPAAVIPLVEEDGQNIDQIVRLLWSYCSKTSFPYTVVNPLLEALFQDYVLQARRERLHSPEKLGGRKEDICRQFLSMVSEHCQQERSLSFYANQLCISVHYLCEAVYVVSGHYPMYFIHQALISDAKYLLGYTNQSAAAISGELNFPNPAWFSRFFKRETGFTPGEFRHRFKSR